MEGELLKILHQAKEAGLGASLTFTTRGGKMKAKLEVELDHSVPVPADPTPAPVKRRRQRGAGARARHNLWAAAHQASQAEAATSVPVRKNENFPDSMIFVAKTFRIKRVKCINFQIRDKYA